MKYLVPVGLKPHCPPSKSTYLRQNTFKMRLAFAVRAVAIYLSAPMHHQTVGTSGQLNRHEIFGPRRFETTLPAFEIDISAPKYVQNAIGVRRTRGSNISKCTDAPPNSWYIRTTEPP